MSKKLILGTVLTLSLAFIVSASCVAPAFALWAYHDQAPMETEQRLLDRVHHQPPIKIAVNHFDGGDHGDVRLSEISALQFIPQLNRYVWA